MHVPIAPCDAFDAPTPDRFGPDDGSPTVPVEPFDAARASITNRRHTRRLLAAWSDDAALAGRTPGGIIDMLADPGDPEHDRVTAALIRRSQARDDDAALLLVLALRPALWRLVHDHQPHRRRDAFDEIMGAAPIVIARFDPGVPRPYFRLVGRIRAEVRQHRADVEVPPLVIPRDDVADHAEAVATSLDARQTLRRIGRIRQTDRVVATGWDDLVALRLRGDTADLIAAGRTRTQVHENVRRCAQRLAEYVQTPPGAH